MDNQISTTQPVPPVPPVSPPAEKPKDWFKTLPIIVVFLIILGLFGVIYLLSRKQTPPVSKITPTPTQTSFLPTPTSDPTANWETYNNTRHSYQVKYPSNWILSENTQPAQINNREIIQDLVSIDVNGVTPRIEIDSANQYGLSVNTVKSKTLAKTRLANLDTYYDEKED